MTRFAAAARNWLAASVCATIGWMPVANAADPQAAPKPAAQVAPGAAAQAAPKPAAQVALKPAAQVAIHPLRDAQATVVARNESRISAEIAARIVSVEADAGQTVRKGQVLVRLDRSDATLALERAQAQHDALDARLALALAQLERATELRARNFISIDALAQRGAEVDALRAESRAAQVQVRTARNALDKTEIRAPFDAAVRARQAQLGELSAPGAPLMTLTELGALEISAAIPAEDAARIASASGFAFEGAERRYEVRLLRLAPVVDRATRTREARFAPVGAAPIAGAEGRLVWADPRPHLPAELAVRRAGKVGVFVADGSKASFVELVGAQEGRPAPLPAGLPGPLVVSGQQALQDGAPIAAR